MGSFTKLITKGTTPKDKSGIGTISFVKVENIANGKISPVSKITEEEHNNYLKRSKLEENDILFSIAGTLGRTAIVDKSILPANTNQALSIIRGYDFNKEFLITSLNGNVVENYIRRNPTVGAQPNLSLEQVRNLIIKIPSLQEQRVLGNFFKKLDTTIALHQKQLEHLNSYKKTMLQKMFPKKGEINPELRFPGFTEDWRKYKLGKIYTERKEKGNADLPILSVSIHTGVSKGELDNESLGKEVRRSEDKTLYKHVYKGDLVLNMMRAWQGAIGVVEIEGMVSPAYITAKPSEKIFPLFMNYYFQKNEMINQINNLSYGLMAFRKRIYWESFVKAECYIPSVEEQEKISALFIKIERAIEFHQSKLDSLLTIKKEFLQRMFV